ncbi:zinc finger A20 and AN1 domain-containing stress-associated protein 1-like [Cannabis sativa]|uniref:zinc finger A20 and AN1 domain-containing stress-associated protein 1-like n=1 Tax=Cannabis sativa TaxID=3483 RepID=UPI0029C9C546|nr:zinc finger A20 and AN1 domain-containing stress-associated protein 1-like [Cannabis sativa]
MDMDDAFNLCVKGCGFYGRVENRNMCSKCYKDFIMEEIICKSLSNIHLSNNITSITTPTFNTTDENDAITNSLCDQFNDLKITKNRCKDCNKKVGLTGFSCRCGNLYCGCHRLPETHTCTYDFKSAARQNLKLTLICADKLEKRL